MRATRWDAVVLLRAAAIALIALALVCFITAASDEGSVAWGARFGRALPLTPLCCAFGVWAALSQPRARGDLRALEAIGCPPGRVAAAPVLGGAFVALAAAGMMATRPAVDVSGFFPSVAQRAAWEWQSGAFEEHTQGLRVGSDGTPIRLVPSRASHAAPTGVPRWGRTAAALATALSGLAMAALSARSVVRPSASRGRRARGGAGGVLERRDGLACALAVALAIALFQASAAHRTHALAAVLPPLALLAFAVARYRSGQ